MVSMLHEVTDAFGVCQGDRRLGEGCGDRLKRMRNVGVRGRGGGGEQGACKRGIHSCRRKGNS